MPSAWDLETHKTIERLYKFDSLLDTLINVEDFFDTFDLYVYDNWIEGQIVSGPHVSKYWISLTLKYDYKKMPDPEGAMMLNKYGVITKYGKFIEEKPEIIDSTDNMYQNNRRKPKMKNVYIWLVELSIPRRFIEIDDRVDLEDYDDELDLDAIEGASDEGLADQDQTEASAENAQSAEAAPEEVEDVF